MSRAIGFDPPIEGGVVVGYDGSAPGLHALRWAWSEACARRLPLHVVRAWTIATAAGLVDVPPGVVPGVHECEQALTAEVADAVRQVGAAAEADGSGGPDGYRPTVHLQVVHGPADEALVAATTHADLVVVGHRGHGLVSLVLGSVAAHVLEHARCPVVVLPAGCLPD